VFGPGTSLSATVLAGGIQYVLSGGHASGTTDSGGADIVLAGGLASGTRVASGGIEVASSGGILLSTTVLAGGIQYVLSGGAASSAADSGGVNIVLAGGVANNTRVASGGIEVVSSGGTLLSATVLASGVEYALSGGLATGTVINGGNEQVLSGGTAAGATVEGGGFLVVSSGGSVNGATISSATTEIQSGGLTGANPITYAGGAALVLDASANFSGTIAGFTGGDFLDLKDIAFGSITSMNFVEAGNNLSGTLTVTDGSHTANLTLLGNYSLSQFTSASDGHGGTVITDPPASSPVLWGQNPDADALLLKPTTSEAATGPSSTVELRGGAVSDGSHTANITLLGNYSPSQFTSASDGHGGTVITDPPASSPVLWVSKPDADTLLLKPTTSEAATGPSSTVELSGGAVGSLAAWQGPTVDTWLGDAGLLWQPAASVMAAAGCVGQGSTLSGLTMHQPSLGG